MGFGDLEPDLVERVARDAGQELADVQYVLLGLGFDSEPQLRLYLPEGSEPRFVRAPQRG